MRNEELILIELGFITKICTKYNWPPVMRADAFSSTVCPDTVHAEIGTVYSGKSKMEALSQTVSERPVKPNGNVNLK
jgi:hypothetical protein